MDTVIGTVAPTGTLTARASRVCPIVTPAAMTSRASPMTTLAALLGSNDALAPPSRAALICLRAVEGAGYLLIVTRRFFSTEKGKELVEASAIETNKMLGLSFQGQGMLDMAFEKFRLCPLDDNLKDIIEHLMGHV